MTDISFTPSLDDGEAAARAAAAADSMFYVVSRRKLTILFIVTFGMYGVYWFYKNWNQYRNHARWTEDDRPSIWPIPRAIFLVFFIHSLFSEVKALGSDKPQVAAWRNNLHAWIMVVLYVGINLLDRIERMSGGQGDTGFWSLVGMALLLVAYLKAQSMINAAVGDPDGKGNDKLTGANYVWIVIGGLIWVLAIIGTFMPGGSEGFSASSSGGF